MTTSSFPAQEYGSGRLTPVVDAPPWLKAKSKSPFAGPAPQQAPQTPQETERVTLSPSDQAFLASSPTYGEGQSPTHESLIPAANLPVRAKPSWQRRVAAIGLFMLIGGGALSVLVLAALRVMGHDVLH